MSSSLNLRLEILNSNKALNFIEGKFKFKHDIFKLIIIKTNKKKLNIDKMLTIDKLIHLHPLYINLWMQLADVIFQKLTNECLIKNNEEKNAFIRQYLVCYSTINELIRHGYQYRSQVSIKNKEKQKLWVIYCFIFIYDLLF
jgi:hypothetical protein